MLYTEVELTLEPFNSDAVDVLQAFLGEKEFESFENTNTGFKAFIPKVKFTEAALKEVVSMLPFSVSVRYSISEVAEQNWNEIWEKNYFQPIVIHDQVLIRSSFHKTDAKCKYEILIDPKMAFGTGHHSTTWLVAERITRTDVIGKKVLDMGCGTGILAILTAMKGAKEVVGIDIDEWAFSNCMENIRLNDQSDIDVRLGGAEKIGADTFDLVLANINRNILLQDMATYARALNKNGRIFFSGFYTEDLEIIRATAEENGLTYKGMDEKMNWVVAEFEKKS